MVLRHADAFVCEISTALAVCGKLVDELCQLRLVQMVFHAHDLDPCLVILHLPHHLLDIDLPRARRRTRRRINCINLYIILLWRFCRHFGGFSRHLRRFFRQQPIFQIFVRRVLSPSGGDDEILLDVAAGEHLLLFEEGAVEELPFHEGVDDFLHLVDGDAWKFFEQDDIVFRCPFEVVSVAVDGAQEHDDGCLALDAVHHGDGADSGVIEKIYIKGK